MSFSVPRNDDTIMQDRPQDFDNYEGARGHNDVMEADAAETKRLQRATSTMSFARTNSTMSMA